MIACCLQGYVRMRCVAEFIYFCNRPDSRGTQECDREFGQTLAGTCMFQWTPKQAGAWQLGAHTRCVGAVWRPAWDIFFESIDLAPVLEGGFCDTLCILALHSLLWGTEAEAVSVESPGVSVRVRTRGKNKRYNDLVRSLIERAHVQPQTFFPTSNA